MEILSEYQTVDGRSILICEDSITYEYVVMSQLQELYRAYSMGSVFNFLATLGKLTLVYGGL